MIQGRVVTPTQPLAGAEDVSSGDARIVKIIMHTYLP